jgi:hypothetical protein
VYFDLHGDATPYLLRSIAAQEWKQQEHLSDRVIVIAPGDREMSVGLNPLGEGEPDFVSLAEIAELLKMYWGLDRFGARTDELLRNALYVLAANGLTLLELAPLLTHPGFRTGCLKRVPNAEVRQYFELRYGTVSEPMRATMREPILNKISAFTADPRFRHIVGQTKSTFSLREAMDQGYWVIVNLDKGKLGAHALTLGGLLFTMLKNALFARERRSLFTLYVDELQNLIANAADVETMLSEARKFGVGVVSANQFLDQYPAPMRAAILSIGTHCFFQLSSADAATVSQMLDGGNPRGAEVCSKCGSRELSTPQPRIPMSLRLLAILLRLGLGLLLFYASLSLVIDLVRTPQVQRALVVFGMLLAVLWWLWSKLPDWFQEAIRSFWKNRRRNDDD